MPEPDTGYLWLLITILAVGTYAIRLSFLEVFRHVEEVPDWLERALTLVPAAVIAAIIVPRLVFVEGDLLLSVGNEKLLAGGLAALAAWRTGSMIATVTVGMVSLWVLGSIV